MSLVAVCCGKGSPGATFVSVNLASALAGNVLLLDLDPYGGDIAAYLGLDPRRGLHPLTRIGGPTRPEALIREAEIRGSLTCLGGFPRGGEADVQLVAGVLESALATGRIVVADFGRINSATAGLLNRADLILVAVRPDLLGVYGAQRAFDALRWGGIPDAKLATVITGWERLRPADLAETAHALKTRVIGTIPLDRERARTALDAQRPIDRGPAAKAFAALGSEVKRSLATASVRASVSAR